MKVRLNFDHFAWTNVNKKIKLWVNLCYNFPFSTKEQKIFNKTFKSVYPNLAKYFGFVQ
jgi:hypothetical protein